MGERERIALRRKRVGYRGRDRGGGVNDSGRVRQKEIDRGCK